MPIVRDDPGPTPMVKMPPKFMLALSIILVVGCKTQAAKEEVGAPTTTSASETNAQAKEKATVAKDAEAAKVKPQAEQGASPAGSTSAASGDCSFKTGAACQGKCDSGDQKACLWLGAHLGKTADRDVAQREKAITILGRACEAKVQRACVHLAIQREALILKKSKRVLNAEEKTEKFTTMMKACEAGDGVACNSAARNLKEGFGVEKDEAKAKALREKALKLMAKECDADDAESCLALGILSLGGKSGVKEDIPKAKALLERACKLGEDAGCKGVPEGWPSGGQ